MVCAQSDVGRPLAHPSWPPPLAYWQMMLRLQPPWSFLKPTPRGWEETSAAPALLPISSRRVQFRAYVIPEPYRVVVDLEEVNFRFSPGLGGKGLGLIRAYRYGSMDDGRSRIVMDTKGPIEIEKAFVIDPENNQPARLVVDVLPTTPAKFAALYSRIASSAMISSKCRANRVPATGDDRNS